MLVRRLYNRPLAQASYLIGCEATGEALVIDPHRDTASYVSAAASEGMRITGVTETHVHADFVSGSAVLAAQTGARLYLSGEGPGPWSYSDAYRAATSAQSVRDGDTIRVGDVRVGVVHTPGHTPEHITFLVTDGATSSEPIGALTGDFVFVGDVGRPDLLERAARVAGSADGMARQLYRSLRCLAGHPDYLQLLPGHGAGSACGKGLSAIPQSTLGYERRHNWAFGIDDEEAFVRAALDGQPEAPAYFAEMKRWNASGPPAWPDVTPGARLGPEALAGAMRRGSVVIDTRPASMFAAAHIPGTINVPFDRSFLNWVGSLVPLQSEIVLIGSDAAVESIVRSLALIGLDRVNGYGGPELLDGWQRGGGPLSQVRDVSPPDLEEWTRHGRAAVVDVRARSEWESGHLPGAMHVPLAVLRTRLADLPRDRVLVTQCQSGSRSVIAASVLEAAGFTNVAQLTGGMAAWERAGQTVERDRAP